MNSREILREANMSARPEFYSGRGAIRADLNDGILEKIHQGVQREYGEEAAKQFTIMVANIPVLSATDFLISFYALENHGWKYDSDKVRSDAPRGILVAKDEEGNYDYAHGMLSMVDAISLGGRDETAYIKGQFLRRHGIEPSKHF